MNNKSDKFYFIKFQHKSACRLLMRKLTLESTCTSMCASTCKPNPPLIKCSSLFRVNINNNHQNYHLYMLIKIKISGESYSDISCIRDVLAIQEIPGVVLIPFEIEKNYKKIQGANPVLQSLYEWAYAEVNQSLKFVEIESRSIAVNQSSASGCISDVGQCVQSVQSLQSIRASYLGRQLIINHAGVDWCVIRTYEYLPEVFGIINYTSDSFSDGGIYNSVELVCKRIEEYIANNVNIIDIGVESTRPNATQLTAELEIIKLKEILPEVMRLKQYYNSKFSECGKCRQLKISIDTYHSETVQYLNDANLGIDFINDVSGAINENLIKNVTDNGTKYIAMHSLTIPPDKNKIMDIHSNVVEDIYQWMVQKLESLVNDYQINPQSIILDPGIGFGNNPAQAWYIINNLHKFTSLPCEILLGHSRKSLLGHVFNLGVTEAKDRDLETAVVAIHSMPYVDYLRLHDVSILNRMCSVKANLL